MLIGVSGKAFSGKDTFADVLSKRCYEKTKFLFDFWNHSAHGVKPEDEEVKHGIICPVVSVAFAKKLKSMAMEHFSLTQEQVYGLGKEVVVERYGKTPRTILQEMGAFYRSIHKNYWVDAVLDNLPKDAVHHCITDVRFENEYKGIKKRKGIVIRIERDISLRASVSNPAHISEVDLDGAEFDLVIDNNKRIEDLNEYADVIIENYLFPEDNQSGKRYYSKS
jgi:hypothetical protein